MCLILAILLVSASISLPLAVYQTVTCNKEHNIYICHERSPEVTSRQFFTICSLVLQAVHHSVLGHHLLLLSSFLRPAQCNSPYSQIGRFAGRIELLFARVFTSHVTATSSNNYNPFLYAWMNDNFQTEFRRVLPCLISRGRITKKQTGASLSLYSVMETRGPKRISAVRCGRRGSV